MLFGKGLQLQASARAEHQNVTIRSHTLRQKQSRHPVKVGKAWNLARRRLSIRTRVSLVEGGDSREVGCGWHVTFNVTN